MEVAVARPRTRRSLGSRTQRSRCRRWRTRACSRATDGRAVDACAGPEGHRSDGLITRADRRPGRASPSARDEDAPRGRHIRSGDRRSGRTPSANMSRDRRRRRMSRSQRSRPIRRLRNRASCTPPPRCLREVREPGSVMVPVMRGLGTARRTTPVTSALDGDRRRQRIGLRRRRPALRRESRTCR